MACNHEHCTQHHHSKEELEEKEDKKKEIILYLVAVVLFLITFIPILPEGIKITFYVLTLLVSGYELFLEGIKNIFHFKFEEDTLMTIAVIAACCLGDFREACLVVLLFSLGEFIEDLAVEKSNQHIETIVDMKTETANCYQRNEVVVVPVENLKVGDKILIKPGEMVPVDSRVLSGKSQLDTSRLTGESEPIIVAEGQEILSGNSNLSGSLTAEVIREYKDSTASQIIDLVYEATNNKGKTEKFITKFSRIYTPTVMILALAISIIPILIGLDARTWITRALVFLVASCPCSIVISIPLAFFSCVGVLSKKGLLVKGTKHIEALAKAKTICFDKTGTITTGKMVIDEISESEKKKEFFSYLYSLEHLSNHPIATSIENEVQKQGWEKEELLQEVLEQEEIAGYGIKGVIQGKQVLFGNQKLLAKYQIPYPKDLNKKGIYLAVDGKLSGYITLKEEIRKASENLKANLEKIGIHKIVMLTGDGQEKAEEISQKIGEIEVYASLLPKEKLEKVEEFKKNSKVIFVGDGINDSPVLATADFSISMGEGTQIAS
ncbi:MAG: cadmium-translocating P-type ATPase, partial [Clostridia bacterium]|nr:cadmium-translocating P-type ATPase [Clostridia bacterium]